MSEVIVPITQFTDTRGSADLAIRTKNLVNNPQVYKLLKLRHLTGVIGRYPGAHGDDKETDNAAVRSIQNVRGHHREQLLGAYAVLDDKGDVIGMGTVIPRLRLRRHRLPLPKRMSRGILQERIAIAGPEVSVWTNETGPYDVDEAENTKLSQAYQALLAPNGPAEQLAKVHDTRPNVWTIEPTRVPTWIHHAIIQSNMQPRGRESRFDDAEPEKWSYPMSVLYSTRPVAQLAVVEA